MAINCTEASQTWPLIKTNKMLQMKLNLRIESKFIGLKLPIQYKLDGIGEQLPGEKE